MTSTPGLQLVIIGLGIAGLSAVEGARSENPDIPITVIGAEPYYAYFRPRLSHLLGSEIDPSEIAVKSPEWYGKQNALVMLGKRATNIDTVARAVILEDGTRIQASTVVLACGSSPALPPLPGLDRKGVFSLRSIEDARAITEQAGSAKTCAMVGAGPLGLEAAWAVSRLGVKVHLLEHGSRLLARVLDEKGSAMLAEIVREAGIELHLSAASESVTSDGISLKGGERVPGEMVLFSTGIRPNLDVPRAAGLSVNKAVLAGKDLATSEPWIFAAGDVAEVNGALGGTWPVAMAQGRVAGANAAGGHREYQPVPNSYTLMVMGTKIFTIGNVVGGDGFIETIEEDPARRVYRKLIIDGDKLVGALLLGDLRGFDKIREACENGRTLKSAHEPEPSFSAVLSEIIS